MPSCLEPAAQLAEVVDLAVAHGPDGARLVDDGLSAAFKIDDAEATHRQADVAVDVGALIIRASVSDAGRHGRQPDGINGLMCPEVVDAADAAHCVRPRASEAQRIPV